jgi:hypothetical protein
MGRPPLNGRAMTGAERQRRLRQRRRLLNPANDPAGWRQTYFLPVVGRPFGLVVDLLDDPVIPADFATHARVIVDSFGRFDEIDRALRRRWQATIRRHRGRPSRETVARLKEADYKQRWLAIRLVEAAYDDLRRLVRWYRQRAALGESR